MAIGRQLDQKGCYASGRAGTLLASLLKFPRSVQCRALKNHQVDVVKILSTTKTVCQVVLRIHCRPQFATAGTLEAEVTITVLGDRTVTTEPPGEWVGVAV